MGAAGDDAGLDHHTVNNFPFHMLVHRTMTMFTLTFGYIKTYFYYMNDWIFNSNINRSSVCKGLADLGTTSVK